MRFVSSLLWQLYQWSARHSGHTANLTSEAGQEMIGTWTYAPGLKVEGTWTFPPEGNTGGAAGA